jgi:hypothetical protein
MFTGPLLACTAPGIRSGALVFGAPKKADLLAAIDGTANVDAYSTKILRAMQ